TGRAGCLDLVAGRARKPRREPETRATPELALDADVAAHDGHQLFYDRQAESGAATRARHRRIDLVEGFENPRLLFGIDADPGVGEGATQDRLVFDAIGERHLDQDLAALGKLNRIADEVDQYLPQTGGVAGQTPGHLFGDEIDEFEPLAGATLAEQVG